MYIYTMVSIRRIVGEKNVRIEHKFLFLLIYL